MKVGGIIIPIGLVYANVEFVLFWNRLHAVESWITLFQGRVEPHWISGKCLKVCVKKMWGPLCYVDEPPQRYIYSLDQNLGLQRYKCTLLSRL